MAVICDNQSLPFRFILVSNTENCKIVCFLFLYGVPRFGPNLRVLW